MALPTKFDKTLIHAAQYNPRISGGAFYGGVVGVPPNIFNSVPWRDTTQFFGRSKCWDRYGQCISHFPEIAVWIRPMMNDKDQFDITGWHHEHLNMNARPVWWPTRNEVQQAKLSGHFPQSIFTPDANAPDYTTHLAFEGEEYSMSSLDMQTWQNTGTIGVFVRFDGLDRDQYIWALQSRAGLAAKVYLSWNAEDYRLLARFFGISTTFSPARLLPDRPYYIQVSWNRGHVQLAVADLLDGTYLVDDGQYEENVARREPFNGWLVLGGLATETPAGLYGGFRGIAGDLFFSRYCLNGPEINRLTLCEKVEVDDTPVEP